MDNIVKFLKYFLVNLWMAFRSLFWEREAGIILIGSWFGEKYADNSRYLYEYLSNHMEELGLAHVVWVSENNKDIQNLRAIGYEAYWMHSKESIRYHKRAGLHIVCNSSSGNGDILGQYSYGAKKLNLWHGVGVKSMAYTSNEFKRKKKKYRLIYNLYEFCFQKYGWFRSMTLKGGWANCYYLATGRLNAEALKKCLWLTDKNIIISNYPRNCECQKLMKEESELIQYFEKFEKIVLYLPTFRNEETVFDLNLTLRKLGEINDSRILMIAKLHQASNMNPEDSNILILPKNFDINVIIPHIDVLLTDYSSCALDAMYHNKKCVFFIPDLKEYLNGDTGFLYNPEKYMCGYKVSNLNELNQKIIEACYRSNDYMDEQYHRVKNLFWEDPKELDEIWHDIRRCIYAEK